MKRKIILLILLIIGIILMIYPTLSGLLANETQTIAITKYQENVKKISKEQQEKMLEEARLYNEKMASVVANDEIKTRSYADYLNVGDIMAYISIPKIDLYLPIYHGTEHKTLEVGVGHMQNTSLPIGGKSTHSVIAGHTGLTRERIFDNINELQIGDIFYIHVLENKLQYKVDQIKTVLPSDDSDLQIIPDADYITLLTCTPPLLNTYRLLVRGTRVEDIGEIQGPEKFDESNLLKFESKTEEEIQENITQKEEIVFFENLNLAWLIVIIIIFALVVIIFFISKKKGKKSK